MYKSNSSPIGEYGPGYGWHINSINSRIVVYSWYCGMIKDKMLPYEWTNVDLNNLTRIFDGERECIGFLLRSSDEEIQLAYLSLKLGRIGE